MNWELFTAFLLITVVLILVPGPMVTLIVATGAAHGVRAALLIAAGGAIGLSLLLTAIAFGLSWILQNAVALFEILRWCGVAYLLWLGIQTWRHAGLDVGTGTGGRVYFWRGVAAALTNPKTIAFFTAFLPQFVDPSLPAGRQLLVMCAASVLIAWVCDSGWAVAAGLGRGYLLKLSPAKMLGRLSGAALIGGGVWLSLVRRSS